MSHVNAAIPENLKKGLLGNDKLLQYIQMPSGTAVYCRKIHFPAAPCMFVTERPLSPQQSWGEQSEQ